MYKSKYPNKFYPHPEPNTWVMEVFSKKTGWLRILVDAEDVQRLRPYQWSLQNSTGDSFYFKAHINRKRTHLHRFLLGVYSLVDHKDGHSTLDCRKSNLRMATHQQNSANQRPRKNKSSKFKGVHWHKKQQKWRARVVVSGKIKNLGLYKNEMAAAFAYNVAAVKHFGEFAHVNDITLPYSS